MLRIVWIAQLCLFCGWREALTSRVMSELVTNENAPFAGLSNQTGKWIGIKILAPLSFSFLSASFCVTLSFRKLQKCLFLSISFCVDVYLLFSFLVNHFSGSPSMLEVQNCTFYDLQAFRSTKGWWNWIVDGLLGSLALISSSYKTGYVCMRTISAATAQSSPSTSIAPCFTAQCDIASLFVFAMMTNCQSMSLNVSG